MRRVTLPGHTAVLPTHSTCYDRDWEALESGLEPFELRLTNRSGRAS